MGYDNVIMFKPWGTAACDVYPWDIQVSPSLDVTNLLCEHLSADGFSRVVQCNKTKEETLTFGLREVLSYWPLRACIVVSARTHSSSN